MLTDRQKAWLTAQGGRHELEVGTDDNGPFVLMYHPRYHHDIKVYVPSDERLDYRGRVLEMK